MASGGELTNYSRTENEMKTEEKTTKAMQNHNMKRAKTTYTPTTIKSVGLHIGEEDHQDAALSPLRGERKLTFSQANASWSTSEPSKAWPRNLEYPQKARNMFLQNDKEINSLLSLLRTNNFSGEIDPIHHSQYMNEPRNASSKKHKPRRLGESYHRSDGHLLNLKCQRGALTTIRLS